MKRFIYFIAALVAVFCWGCSNHALEDIQETSSRNDDVKMLSRSVGTIDYSQYTLLENRTVMPRTGESYQGTVTYKGTGFPVYIFWDFDFAIKGGFYHFLFFHITVQVLFQDKILNPFFSKFEYLFILFPILIHPGW